MRETLQMMNAFTALAGAAALFAASLLSPPAAAAEGPEIFAAIEPDPYWSSWSGRLPYFSCPEGKGVVGLRFLKQYRCGAIVYQGEPAFLERQWTVEFEFPEKKFVCPLNTILTGFKVTGKKTARYECSKIRDSKGRMLYVKPVTTWLVVHQLELVFQCPPNSVAIGLTNWKDVKRFACASLG